MIRLARWVTMPFLIVPVVLLLIFYGEDAASDFIDNVNDFFRGL